MKLKLLFLAALVIGAFAVNSQMLAQDEPIVGGYGDMSVKSAEALRNARFAVSSRAKRTGQKIVFVKLLKAEQQVVAGLNYRLCMRVRLNGRLRTVTAVVYKNLRNRKSLTNWKTGGCTDL
jgi:hypothetical protein